MKINIGRDFSGKKYLHQIPRNVTTTANFGFCQPLQCREFASGDSISLRTGKLVRLQPVVKPTFGTLMVKQYDGFVPIEDIYHPFASLLAGKTYSGANASYIPTTLPAIPQQLLTFFVYLNSGFQVWKDQTDTPIGIVDNGIEFADEPVIDNTLTTTQVINALVNHVGVYNTISPLTTTHLASIANAAFNSAIFYRSTKITKWSECDWFFAVPGQGQGEASHIIGGRFTEAGKNIRKVLLGCGIHLNFNSDAEVSLCKLVAFYKFWFDCMAVQRTVSWKNTVAYNMMEQIEQGNLTVTGLISSDYAQGINEVVFAFIRSLRLCYYNSSPDFLSAHIVGTAISQDTNNYTYLAPGNNIAPINSGINTHPYSLTNVVISQSGLDVLKKLYQYINSKTSIGGKIKEFMNTLYGSEYRDEKESNFISAESMSIDITDVMSTAETSEGYLGEYAGQGKGRDFGKVKKFDCKCPGWLVSFICVVPDARYCQGDDPDNYHLTKFHFFTPRFDALTLLPTKKTVAYNANDLSCDGWAFNTGSFGNIPNYSEYKVNHDVINGDVSMLSTQASLLPFTLNKLLPYTQVDEQNGSIYNTPYQALVAGDAWRSVGLYPTLGNYDRIFYNSGDPDLYLDGDGLKLSWLDKLGFRMDDNFIIYNHIDMSYYGYELPLSESFQTDGFGDSFKVEKA